ncbi:YybH family protein [Methylophaga sp.]|uniref:YybH family protein n=1 Tax=Methylophaga sp. TaxID=2024840 RepID=UPI003F6A02AC
MRNIFVIAAVLIMSFQVNAAELLPQNIVKNANQQWNSALNDGKIDRLVTLYAEDATLSPGNGEVLKGHAEIEKLFAGFIQNGVHNHQIETIDVMATDKQITQLAYWQANGVDAEQNTVQFGGVLGIVFEKNNADEWKMKSHIWNTKP